MTDPAPLTDAISHLLRVVADLDDDLEGIWPQVRDGQLSLTLNCNDMFYWACADCETFEPGDEALLDAVVADLREHGGREDDLSATCYWMPLFCCRKRGMRPQHPFFRTYDRVAKAYTTGTLTPGERALFDACGPADDKDRG